MDAVTAGRLRLPEFKDYVLKLRGAIQQEKPDLVSIKGDYFDPGGMNAHGLTVELMFAVEGIHRDTFDVGGRDVWIPGNHDVIETSEGYTTISPVARAVRGGFCHSTRKDGIGPDIGPVICERPKLIEFPTFYVLALPYVARAVGFDYQDGVDKLFESKRHDLPVVVMGHLTVPGATLGSESKEMARGRDVDLPNLTKWKPRVVMNGHYHRAQRVKVNGYEVIIPGSPMRFNFGEARDGNKGYTIIEF